MESPFREPVPDGTCLIETFGWSPGGGFRNLDLHLSRMARSARALGFAYDGAAARDVLAVQGEAPLRCRLTLGREGFGFSSAPLGQGPATWRVALAQERVCSHDPWLAHKTTQRALYDAARAALPEGVDEILFLNERGELCEGTISTLFVQRPDGQMVTPPLSSGVLPGILRQTLLESGKAREGVLFPDDLEGAEALFMGNSLRGMIAVDRVAERS